jgi:hypothetical protein
MKKDFSKKVFEVIERNCLEIEESSKNGIIAHKLDVDDFTNDLFALYRSSLQLNNGLKVNELVKYKSEKYTIITINESEQKAVIKRWNTKWKIGNIPLSELIKIV